MAATTEGARAYHDGLFWRLFGRAAVAIDHRWGWHKLPTPLGIVVLIGVRDVLRRENLFDTATEPTVDPPPVPPFEERFRTMRTADGSHNDLELPAMGMAGSRFGRNIPLTSAAPETGDRFHTPSPRTVSRRLMTRNEFQPATGANALVASWLQFMIRDWFSHGKSPKEDPWEVDLAPDDPWPAKPMRILRTRADPTRPTGFSSGPATFANTESPWWDGSNIYGSSKSHQQLVRSGKDGKLHVTATGQIPYPTDPEVNPALVPGFWLGLAMMGNIWTLEHNSICGWLHEKYPAMDDEELFQRARLVNAALIAKVHTVEWTPAVISHPTTVLALRTNWWGLAGERLHKRFGRISSSEVISGIPGSEKNHYGVPYSLTEEFVAVYRMHPLVPDDYSLRALADDQLIRQATLRDLAGEGALEAMSTIPMRDLFYSFGTQHPGIVTLHNFPRFLQEFVRPDGELMDLASVDILRSRELGVPRYNDFRRFLHLPPAKDFSSLTDNPVWARELSEVYNGDIEAVDVTPGMYAEPRPQGFAFSDTAFRVFVLMASRRLNSDRFFTDSYTTDVYTQAGLDWIEDNTMLTVLHRHFPELREVTAGVENAFHPWSRAGSRPALRQYTTSLGAPAGG